MSSWWWYYRTPPRKRARQCRYRLFLSSIVAQNHRWFRLTPWPLCAGSLSKWSLFFHHRINWISFWCSPECPCLRLWLSSVRETIRNLFDLNHQHLDQKSFDRWFDFSTRSQAMSWRPWALRNMRNVCTLGVNGSSTIGIKQIECFLYLENFFFSQAGSFKWLGVELVGFLGTFFHLTVKYLKLYYKFQSIEW